MSESLAKCITILQRGVGLGRKQGALHGRFRGSFHGHFRSLRVSAAVTEKSVAFANIPFFRGASLHCSRGRIARPEKKRFRSGPGTKKTQPANPRSNPPRPRLDEVTPSMYTDREREGDTGEGRRKREFRQG